MATIKLQNGKVITKDGKVACECCEVGCCMYPAQALADGLYTVDDLPDDVTVNGTSFPRSGTTYGNTTNGVILEINVWVKYTNGVASIRPCLIQGGVEDQFADSYIIAGFPFAGTIAQYPLSPPFDVNRISACRWEKTVDGTLYYGNPDFPPASGKWTSIIELYEYYFKIFLIWVNNDSNDFYYPPTQVFEYTKLGPPSEPNSSPSGTYSGEGGITWGPLTVS